jgi:hypothetical protein
MNIVRSSTRKAALALAGIASLIGGEATAVTYQFTGWVTSNRGKFINIPVVGNTPCVESRGSGTTPAIVFEGPGGNMVPVPNTPTGRISKTANPTGAGLCVKASGTLSTTGAGTNGAFEFPVDAFSRPAVGVLAVPVPNTPQVVQLATDFGIEGPLAARVSLTTTLTAMEGPTMTGSTPAHRQFRTNAHTTQDGRAGAMFTWCPGGNDDCTKITEGPLNSRLIVKYTGGGNNFSGTMGYVIDGASPDSNLAIILGAPPATAAFIPLVGMGDQPTGNGYAIRLVDNLGAASAWTMYQFGPVTTPIVGMRSVITMVSGVNIDPFLPSQENINYGFPWTTNTVLARNTGTVFANPMVTTISANGNDSVTAMGKRNISLVAGGLAHLSVLASNTPGIAQMYLPEPTRGAQLLAGALGLLAVAAWRSRRSR